MKYIILLSFLFFIPISQADIHIEPYASAGGSYSASIPSSPDSFFMSFAVGGRFGYSFLGASLGFDLFWNHYSPGISGIHNVRYDSQPIEPGFNQGRGSFLEYSVAREPFQPFSIGLFTAIDLPFLFNVYGTVFYSIPAESVNADYQGYGMKAGMSYISAFYVQLNLEFQWAYYHCVERMSCSNNFNILSAFVSLSLPFSTDVFDFGNVDDSENSDTEESESDSSDDI